MQGYYSCELHTEVYVLLGEDITRIYIASTKVQFFERLKGDNLVKKLGRGDF